MKCSKWMAGVLLFSSGCAAMNNAEMGAVDGGIIGGFMGAVVGALATRNPLGLLVGAGAGAAAGAGIGALHGDAIDRTQQAHVQAINDANAGAVYAAQHPNLSLEEIADMSAKRLSDTIIINQIITTGSTYLLSTEQILWLRDRGVSDYVISYMQSRGPQVVQPGGVIVVPAPPVPIGVGVRVGVR